MISTGENMTSNSYIRAKLSHSRTTSMNSLLQIRDQKYSTLNTIAGLLCGRGARIRMEQKQEREIMISLPKVPVEERFEAARQDLLDQIAALLQAKKALGKGSKERTCIHEELDVLLDRLIDNPYQVSATSSPQVTWADEVGGSITGIREPSPSPSRQPWKAPNFGIEFRFRQKEEDCKPPKRQTLPGGRSLYGEQWCTFERKVSFSHHYDPTPHDPDYPANASVPTIESAYSAISGSGGLEIKFNGPFKASFSQIHAIAGCQGIKAGPKIYSQLSNCIDQRDSSTHAQAPSTIIPVTRGKSSHTIPARNNIFDHRSCFYPEVPLPESKRNITKNAPDGQDKTNDKGLAHSGSWEAIAAFFRVASDLNITLPELPESNPVPQQWEIFREQQIVAEMEKRAADHRMVCSPRSENHGYNANRMMTERMGIIEKRRLRYLADGQKRAIKANEKLAAVWEASCIQRDKRTLAQTHGYGPSNTEISSLERRVHGFRSSTVCINGVEGLHAVTITTKNIALPPQSADTKDGLGCETASLFLEMIDEEEINRPVVNKAGTLVKEKKWEEYTNEADWEDVEDGEGEFEEVQNGVVGIPCAAPRADSISPCPFVAVQNAAALIKKSSAGNVGFPKVKSTAPQAKITDTLTFKKITPAIRTACSPAESTSQPSWWPTGLTGESVLKARGISPPPPAPRPALKRKVTFADQITPPRTASKEKCKGKAKNVDFGFEARMATTPPVPIPSNMAVDTDCAIESDSDDSFDPTTGFLERRPSQYSVGGTRMFW